MENDTPSYKVLTRAEFLKKANKRKHGNIINTLKEYKSYKDFEKHYKIVETGEYLTLMVVGFVEVDLVATAKSKYGNEIMKVTCPLRERYKDQIIAEKIVEDSTYVGAKKEHKFSNFKY